MILRLVSIALAHWADIDGFAVSRNMPPLKELSVSRLTSFIWWFFTRNLDNKDRTKFEIELWKPPAGSEVTKGPWSPEEETKTLRGLQNQLDMIK